MLNTPAVNSLAGLAVALVDGAHRVLVAYGPTDCVDFAPPAPHLGYGINVRFPDRIPSLVTPLGFEWVKLWEEYGSLPDDPLPQKVLYNITCGPYVEPYIYYGDLSAWRDHVRAVATLGRDRVHAYEICNEPNVRNANWAGQAPDPQAFTALLCAAYQEIKAVHPEALVVSGGLAPVGRIPPPWDCGEGNNCNAMDERLYLQRMVDYGAGACMDAFGYHPYGFAYPPERDPDLVSNGFTFRGIEAMHDILVARGLGEMPLWVTEFNWLRRPADDGNENCDNDPTYQTYFKWQEVSAATQADYLVRAFQYADTHWPWLEGLFVWNLDWHDYLTWEPCFHSRYYALRRMDGTYLGADTPAYLALAAMEKRPGPVAGPRLSVVPAYRPLIAEVGDPRVLTATFTIENAGGGTLTWTAAISPASTLAAALSPTTGQQGEQMAVRVDTTGLAVGWYTATLRVEATAEETVRDTPQLVTVGLHVVPEFQRFYLPLILRAYTPPVSTLPPHGPSKLGLHTIGEGDSVAFVQQVHDAGAHVALVKGLTFGHLCDIKRISPETVTIGRWSDAGWEAVTPEGDPAEAAARYMARHMQEWAPYRDCVDYWEVLNEVDPPTTEGHVWLAQFFKAAMSIAEGNGYRLAIFSYSMGVPEFWEWQAIAETGVFAQARDGGHILSLHEYGGPLMSDRWGEPLPQVPGQDPNDPSLPRYPDRGVLAGRYRHLYRDILIPRGEVIPLAITEANVAIEDPEARAPYFLDQMAWYDDRLREDDYVIGMAIFTLGSLGGWAHFDYAEFLPELADRIVALKDQ